MKKVMIIGPGNAGKSTLAVKLGKKLNLPVYHLDKYFWLPDWKPKEKSKWEAEHLSLVSKSEWIIEGDFSRWYETRAQYADTIIFLDIPNKVLIPRSFVRRITYLRRSRPDMTDGNIEKFDYGYYRYLRWLLKYDRSEPTKVINKYKENRNTYVFKTQKQVDEFLKFTAG